MKRCLLCLALVVAGCKRTEVDQGPPEEPAEVLPDQIAPGEVLESPVDLFGLPLPTGMRMIRHMQFQATAIGDLPFESVANYVRDRLETKTVETGPSSTMFIAAKVKAPRKDPEGKPYPDFDVRVLVSKAGTATEVTVWATETTPPDLEIPPSPPRVEERVPRAAKPDEGE